MSKRKKRRSSNNWWLILIVAILGMFLKGNDVHQVTNNLLNQVMPQNNQTTKSVTDSQLSQLTFKSGDPAYIYVNHNRSTLNPKDWKTNRIDYGNLDRLNRTTQATGYLSRANLVKSSTRTSQTWNPTGWHQKRVRINGRSVEIQNRGHLLA